MVLYMCVIIITIEFRYFSLWSFLYIPSCLLSCSTFHNERVTSVLVQLNPLCIYGYGFIKLMLNNQIRGAVELNIIIYTGMIKQMHTHNEKHLESA